MRYSYEGATRRVHLDFHTPHWVKQVGRRFDGARFIETLQKARVNAVTAVFGMCACGNAYWNTRRDDIRHPGLTKDLAAELLEAARGSDVQVYIHFSMAINNRAVEQHPDWAMQRRDGSRLDGGADRHWAWPCFNSPYVEEWVWPLFHEFFARYRPHGVFLDMVMYPGQTCYCPYCQAAMAAEGVDPGDRGAHHAFLERTLDRFMSEAYARVKEVAPEVALTCNNQVQFGRLRRRRAWMDYVELEAPASWNTWGFPLRARYAGTCDIPFNGMTTRFLRSWGYFGTINPIAQTLYECATILATAGAVGIGDHLHPSGEPEQAVYDHIGHAYRYVEAREPWTLGARLVRDVAVLADPVDEDGEPKATYGAGKALLDGSRHFEIIDPEGDWEGCRALIAPENRRLTPAVVERLRRYVTAGGRLILIGLHAWLHAQTRPVLEALAGVRYEGEALFQGAYLSLPLGDSSREGALPAGLPAMPHYVAGRFARLAPLPETEVLAGVVHPYEELDTPPRFGHFHAPAGEPASYPGITRARAGTGEVVCIAAPVATDYFVTGNPVMRRLLLGALDLLLPARLRCVELENPSPAIEVSLAEKDGNWIVHVIQFAANRSTGANLMEEVPVRPNVALRVRPPYAVKRVVRLPQGAALPIEAVDAGGAGAGAPGAEKAGASVRVVLPELHIHEMLLFER